MKEQRYPQLDERAVTATLPNGLTVIGDKISALFGKPRLWHHAYG